MLGSIILSVSKIYKVKTVKCKLLNTRLMCRYFSDSLQVESEELNDKLILTTVKDKLFEAKTQFDDGYTCLKIKTCSFCSLDSAESTGTTGLFINKKTGNFLCHQCKVSGSWTTLINFLSLKDDGLISDLKKECKNYDMTNEWQDIVNDCKSLCDVSSEDFKSVLRNFGLIPFKKEIAHNLNIHLNIEKNLLLFPITYQNTVLGMMALDSSGNSSTFPKSNCAGCLLYNSNNNHNNKSVIVVADIKDFTALISLNLAHDIVCLPYGVTTLPQTLLPSFEMYEKVILWLGIKPGAWNSSIQFAKKLIEKRCYLIRPTEHQISAEKAVLSSQNVNSIIKNAKPIWHKFVTTFSSLREDVLAEIQNLNEISGVKWSRFPKLNKILQGHRRGELTVLTGQTGSGKTTFLSEYSLDLAINGVTTLWGSFEIKNSRLARKMLQQYSNVPLRHDNLDDFNYWAEKFERLPIYFLTFHGQHSLKTVMNAVEHCSYVYDIAHIVIDNVQFMIDISEARFNDRFWAQDCILQAFRRFATASNCHVTLVVHPRKQAELGQLNTNSIFGSAKTSQEADNILIIQEPSGTNRKYLQICKNRFTGNLGSMALVFNENTYTFSQSHDDVGSRREDCMTEDDIHMKM